MKAQQLKCIAELDHSKVSKGRVFFTALEWPQPMTRRTDMSECERISSCDQSGGEDDPRK